MHPTPSTTASPAPRIFSPGPDEPSPAKRRKLAASGPEFAASGASSTPVSDPQLDAERRASSLRVLDVWSSLADKYSRRLNEDDILDLRTGDLVRDRGVLSGAPGGWNFGCFADAGSVGHEEEEDDSGDEIGAWDSVDNPFKPLRVPPVQELDPEDARDLKEFLAAEEARKAQHGEDDCDSVDDPHEHNDNDDVDKGNAEAYDVDTEESLVEVEAGSALAQCDEDSVDELDGFDDSVGEGAMLFEISPEVAARCVEPLDQERQCKAKTAAPVSPLGRIQTPAQLRTPPRSRSSAIPPNPPIHKPPPNIPSSQPVATKKGKQPETPAPRPLQPATAKPRSPAKWKGKLFDTVNPTSTPTKKLVPEVIIFSRPRAGTALPESSDERPKTPSKSRGRALSTSRLPDERPAIKRLFSRRASTPSPSNPILSSPNRDVIDVDAIRSSESPAPPSSHRPAKRKRALSEESVINPGEDVHPSFPSSHAKGKDAASSRRTPPHGRRRDSAQQHRGATAPPPQHKTHAPSTASGSWPSYPRYASAVPSYPVPYTPSRAQPLPLPPPPPPDPQLLFAQAMQNISYLAQSSPTGPHSYWAYPTSRYPPPEHSSPYYEWPYQSPHAPSHPHPPLHSSSHSVQHPLSHPQSHPPWPFPQYPWLYTPPAHPYPPATSSPSSYAGGPPSSPESSPLSGRNKGKGKRVSFPDEKRQQDEEEEEGEEGEEEALEMPETPAKQRTRRVSVGPGADAHGEEVLHDDSAAVFGSGSRATPTPMRSKSKSYK